MKVKLNFTKVGISPNAYEPDYHMCLCVSGLQRLFPGAFSKSDACVLEISDEPFKWKAGKLIKVFFFSPSGQLSDSLWRIPFLETEKKEMFFLYHSSSIQAYSLLKKCGFLPEEKWNGSPIKLWIRTR